jgi:hypothetical protein
MRVNTAVGVAKQQTHEGAAARVINPEQQLRRSIMACMLWEDTFYEDGQSVADRIAAEVVKVPFEKVAAIAIEAREKMKLRHAPLYLARALAKRKAGRQMGDLLERIIQRPDELAEFLAIYWKDGKKPLAKQVKVGLARAFRKFDEYALAKYNRDGQVKLRDVLFLSHAKPKDDAQAALWKRLVDGQLQTPDTWEVALSAGKDKKETFERLMREGQLRALAFLRNLRGMFDAGVDEKLVRDYFQVVKLDRVLPFRFISAATYAPKIEDAIEAAMLRSLAEVPKLPGKTAVVVDNSGSMYGAKVSKRSEIDRSDAACALAILIREVCEQSLVIGFGSEAAIVPARRGFALRDAIKKGPGGGTMTDTALGLAEREGYDRIIVITDEQSHQTVRGPKGKGYFVNVATYQNGIGYGAWTHIDGWSEAIVDYIRAAEAQ